MKLHFLGTVSGLWQLPNRTHQSMIFEINGAMYVFTHIGRSIMLDPERAIANVRHHYDGNAMICEDASTIEFKLGGYRL